jgi:hypothetical protein
MMDSVTLDWSWFWFGLLVVVVVARALAVLSSSFISDLLRLQPVHNICASQPFVVWTRMQSIEWREAFAIVTRYLTSGRSDVNPTSDSKHV